MSENEKKIKKHFQEFSVPCVAAGPLLSFGPLEVDMNDDICVFSNNAFAKTPLKPTKVH